MNASLLKWIILLVLVFPTIVFAVEVTGTGSMIPGPLIKIWAETYSTRNPDATIKFKGSNPGEGIKRLSTNEVDFSTLDMPLSATELNKNGLMQFPIALGAVAPIVNLPNVYPGQFRLDGQVLGEILLGNIKKWNDSAIAALNPAIKLPEADIVIIHRASPPGLSTIIGSYLAKTNTQWKSIKGDTMAGTWPASSIEVKDPIELVAAIKKTQYAISYGSVPVVLKNGLTYVQMKNQAGNFVSPSDINVSAAATNAKWDESNSFEVSLSDQPGATSWPVTSASYVLMHKINQHPERNKELLKFFKYSLRYGELNAVLNDFTALPDSVVSIVRASWRSIVDEKGVPIYKD